MDTSRPVNVNEAAPKLKSSSKEVDENIARTGPVTRKKTEIITTNDGNRILCIADVRGELSLINTLAKEARADVVIHTGDFGFFDDASLPTISERTLRHIVQFSPLIKHLPRTKNFDYYPSNPINTLRNSIATYGQPLLSELPRFLSGELSFDVPVYIVWGACEDVQVIEKFRSGKYSIPNLHIVDEVNSHLLHVGGMKVRLFGLGGPYVPFKLFDNGEGKGTIAGAQGNMWTTVLQIGELLETAKSVMDREETKILITHHPVGREGVLSQLANACQADITISAGLHFRYCASYNEFCVNNNQEHYIQKLSAARSQFLDLWETVKLEVDQVVTPAQRQLISGVVRMVSRMPEALNGFVPSYVSPGLSFKNLWNFNLVDATLGWMVLEIKNGHVQMESKSHGFNFGYRRSSYRRPDGANAAPIANVTKPATSQATPVQATKEEQPEDSTAVESATSEEKTTTSVDQGTAKAETGAAVEGVKAEQQTTTTEGDAETAAAPSHAEEKYEEQKEPTTASTTEHKPPVQQQQQQQQQTTTRTGSRSYGGEQEQRFGFHIAPCTSEEQVRSMFTEGSDSLITHIQIRTSMNRYKQQHLQGSSAPASLYAYVYVENQEAVNKALPKLKTPEGVRANVLRDEPYYRQGKPWYRNNRLDSRGGFRGTRGRGRGGRYGGRSLPPSSGRMGPDNGNYSAKSEESHSQQPSNEITHDDSQPSFSSSKTAHA
ncbi:fungal protein [Schizosaccharomyces japonicus yFS275]|uniref:Fungal protein n=1 Tax=Schizosaccharomyces japonicus (strain yFS275 / FY16936) TaxID=402676 RepID=B6JW26_SCHJY|nr:fungal protein [Schizosaccharomyces japonicus yFS275]EEB05577.1 fungal protein [Schizosaccharomyces japonicus yFS275]